MALGNYEVEPLFAEPIFRADLSHAISDEQRAFIKNLAMVRNQTNLISDNLYIFEEPEMASISTPTRGRFSGSRRISTSPSPGP